MGALLVDNASQNVLSASVDLKWRSLAWHIREDQLGLTSARLRGIRSVNVAKRFRVSSGREICRGVFIKTGYHCHSNMSLYSIRLR